ncbi:hypoxanthine phosphoribosyltransferase [Hydrogenobaculum acidophilum]
MRIKPIINSFDLQKRVLELSKTIEKEHEEVVVIGLLNGAFMFVGDLVRYMNKTVYIDFMKVSSYTADKSSHFNIICDINMDIKDKDVILIDDILDTGKTLSKVREIILSKNPKSLKLCTLLDKPSRREVDIKADYVGFEIEDKFVIGYGLDYNGFGRNLNFIAEIEL